jgi:hypothetical protein
VKGKPLENNRSEPGHYVPVHAAVRFDDGHVAMLQCKVNRILRGASMFDQSAA